MLAGTAAVEPLAARAASVDYFSGETVELPDSTVVHPGHGASTTIGRERDANPFLK